MADTTPMEQFEQGEKTIFQALRAALIQQGVSAWHIARTVQGANIYPHDSTFVVGIEDCKTESLLFTREEIADSARSLDSRASAKVQMLVGQCNLAHTRAP